MSAKNKKKKEERFSKIINIKNRQARYEYSFVDTFVAGMSLFGTEIKSIREAKVNISDAFCVIHKGEVFVRNLHISPFSEGTHANHEPMRERKLLLNKKEIRKLESKMDEKGLTVVPTRLFINNKGLAKLEIALAKGKKLHDKRNDIKERDVKRDLARMKY
ncbi:SsrA-binding protein [Fulvitalea axinellae]|uniref:SsrA-binding protein n=1 Tax=Fulvitalea axinellae TaxID=1182444 RepID=A0AAU9DDK2_9BACT|nr:SsrA-binding protein [Fulvitalea axinellae]